MCRAGNPDSGEDVECAQGRGHRRRLHRNASGAEAVGGASGLDCHPDRKPWRGGARPCLWRMRTAAFAECPGRADGGRAGTVLRNLASGPVRLFADALRESGGVLLDAFVPRQSFGDYMELQLADARLAGRVRQCPWHGGAPRSKSPPGGYGGLHGGAGRQCRAGQPATCRRACLLRPACRSASSTIPGGQMRWIASAPRTVCCCWAPASPWWTCCWCCARGATRAPSAPSPAMAACPGPIARVEAGRLSWTRALRRAGPSHHPPGSGRGRGARHSLATGVRRRQAGGRRAMAGMGLGQRAQFLRHLRSLWDVHRHRRPNASPRWSMNFWQTAS